MIEQEVSYGNFKGFIVFPDLVKDKAPGVVLAHAWRGHDTFIRDKARELARLGYIAFAADLYGGGIVAKDNNEALSLMTPLFINRSELQRRINSAYEQLKNTEGVDKERIGAIGFCFGGLTVLELLRSGANIRGVVSFHGVMGDTMAGIQAQRAPINTMKGAILFLHGHNDPLVSREDIATIQKELTQAHVDWQMHIYGHTSHAFTNPLANETSLGLIYNPKAAARAWIAMQNFFTEVL